MLRGLPDRLEREIKQLYLTRVLKSTDVSRLDKFKIKIEDPPNRNHAVFLGGATLADVYKDHDDFWIHKQEYEEKGVKRVILEKCKGITGQWNAQFRLIYWNFVEIFVIQNGTSSNFFKKVKIKVFYA